MCLKCRQADTTWTLSKHQEALHLVIHAIPGGEFSDALRQGGDRPELSGRLQGSDIGTALALFQNRAGDVFLDGGFL